MLAGPLHHCSHIAVCSWNTLCLYEWIHHAHSLRVPLRILHICSLAPDTLALLEIGIHSHSTAIKNAAQFIQLIEQMLEWVPNPNNRVVHSNPFPHPFYALWTTLIVPNMVPPGWFCPTPLLNFIRNFGSLCTWSPHMTHLARLLDANSTRFYTNSRSRKYLDCHSSWRGIWDIQAKPWAQARYVNRMYCWWQGHSRKRLAEQ